MNKSISIKVKVLVLILAAALLVGGGAVCVTVHLTHERNIRRETEEQIVAGMESMYHTGYNLQDAVYACESGEQESLNERWAKFIMDIDMRENQLIALDNYMKKLDEDGKIEKYEMWLYSYCAAWKYKDAPRIEDFDAEYYRKLSEFLIAPYETLNRDGVDAAIEQLCVAFNENAAPELPFSFSTQLDDLVALYNK